MGQKIRTITVGLEGEYERLSFVLQTLERETITSLVRRAIKTELDKIVNSEEFKKALQAAKLRLQLGEKYLSSSGDNSISL